ncbi:Fcf2-domain-containing protein [Conidiobolus coronatus NRRL 28638]|uniref:Fcf2-domain-containing protein n=1 Tax=Conidiobolus coronatus (strain ATCC 28846 / CBS 209.66 / NRRL 28638) TaxID=796925 RepID=A0A137PHI6_CONC2|nr:Fcf2-domain-containing protein [Conidiobolus coronatus NRRL 28638]|eukprot:KXN74442.1 Fcf2-domain-containing protein [Conidiobolus coronatus NRRL 28638]
MTKRQEAKKEKASSAGPKWFNMPTATLTEEAKRDLHIIKLRNVLDRKRFYKKDNNKALPKFFQFGTVIEHSSEFYSSRINKKDRKSTLVEEVLSDDKSKEYFKRKFNEIQEVKSSGGKDYAKNRFKGYKKAKGKGKGKKN